MLASTRKSSPDDSQATRINASSSHPSTSNSSPDDSQATRLNTPVETVNDFTTEEDRAEVDRDDDDSRSLEDTWFKFNYSLPLGNDLFCCCAGHV